MTHTKGPSSPAHQPIPSSDSADQTLHAQPEGPTGRWKPGRKTWPLLAAGLGLIAMFQIQAMTNQAEADKTTSGSPAHIKHVLHGSTPSMAWSPDSRRLVVNSAYEYFGYDSDIRQDLKELGLYLVDVRSGKVSHVISGRQAYHPFWLDNRTLGWGHSVYEKGKAGIFLHKLGSPANTASRVGSVRGVYNTAMGSRLLPSTKGKILFWNGFPDGGYTWMLADPKTGRVTTAPAVHGKPNSWVVPQALAENQCPQKVGKVAVRVLSDQVQVHVGRKRTTLPGTVPAYSNGQCAAPGTNVCSGSLRACLSPDGTRVAYFTALIPAARIARMAGPPTVGHIALQLHVVRIVR